MKKQIVQACLLLAAIVSFSFTGARYTSPPPALASQTPEICYPLTNAQLDKMGGNFAAAIMPEPKLQTFFRDFNIKPVEKNQMIQQFMNDGDAGAVNRFQCNTPWTYYYTYGSCTANYNRPECGFYVRIRYYKKYRFYACKYEEVTISSTVVCC